MFENIFSKLCRCCMANGELDIFATLFESQTIAKILEKILTEQISSGDQLPKTICQQCFNKVISQFSFIRNVRKIQEQLQQILMRKKVDEKQQSNHFPDIKDRTKSEFESDDDQPLSLLCEKHENFKKKKNNKSSKDNSGGIHLNQSELKKDILDKNFSNCESILQKRENYKIDHTITEEMQNIPCKDSNTFNLQPVNDYQYSDGNEQVHNSHSNCKTKKILKHTCNDCSQSFEFIKQLGTHCSDTGHSFPRRFTCEVCSKKFISNTRLNDHMRIHNNERPFACNECGMTFTLSPNLKRHKKRHTGEKSYFCEVCGKGFIQKHALTIHMRLHNGETPYVCDLCGKGFRAKPFLLQHLDKHSGTELLTIKYQKNYLKYGKMKVECKVCHKIITKSGLYNHMKIQHGDGLKKFLCNLCGKTYSSKTSLDVHMNIHTKKNSYECNVCSKSFTHKNYLKSHLKLHSGERPHCCDLCGKTFVQRSHLDRHMRIHTGVKPYACTYCEKAFALNENLKVHIRIHTNETPHYCSICGKGFFNSSGKKKHETSAHQMYKK